MAATDPATARQLDYLKQLACSRGVSFVPPANRLQASRLIDQLKRREAIVGANVVNVGILAQKLDSLWIDTLGYKSGGLHFDRIYILWHSLDS